MQHHMPCFFGWHRRHYVPCLAAQGVSRDTPGKQVMLAERCPQGVPREGGGPGEVPH